jgi:hypothetical protein
MEEVSKVEDRLRQSHCHQQPMTTHCWIDPAAGTGYFAMASRASYEGYSTLNCFA